MIKKNFFAHSFKTKIFIGIITFVLFWGVSDKIAFATISIEEAREYARNTWNIVDVSNSVLDVALQQNYEGIPYLEWIGLLFTFDGLHARLNNGEYYTALDVGSTFIKSFVFLEKILTLQFPGILSTASLATAPILYSLVNFYQSAVETALQNQIKLYIRARELGCSHTSILNANCVHVLMFTDDGWLYIVDEEYKIPPYSPATVPDNTPEQVYNVASTVWDATHQSEQYRKDKNVVGEGLKQVLLETFPTRFMDFEDGVDRQPIRSKIPGMEFTTTEGYDWIYGDWKAGYNGPYPKGQYFSNGNFFAWLGENQGTGRIDFTGATANYLSVWTSTYSGLTMDAYDANDKLIATSGWATYNLNTGKMTQLTVSAPNMAYVLIHDSGNYWLIDDLEIGDLLANTKSYLPENFSVIHESLDTLNKNESIFYTFYNKAKQKIKIIFGFGGSEFSVRIYKPDGTLYNEYQSTIPPIIIDIQDAEPGEWQVKINAIDVPYDNYPVALVVGQPDPDNVANQRPIANAGTNQESFVDSDCLAYVTLDGFGSSDPDSNPISYSWAWDGGSAMGADPTIELPAGIHIITLVVNDGTTDSEPDTVEITVIDDTPPEISLSVSPDTLWTPNHKMVQITPTVTASDNCDSSPVIELISITSNEGEGVNTYEPDLDSTVGDGNTSNDIQVDTSGNIFLRAERSGTGSGRIYTITYQATDTAGNSATASATVTVPHNQ